MVGSVNRFSQNTLVAITDKERERRQEEGEEMEGEGWETVSLTINKISSVGVEVEFVVLSPYWLSDSSNIVSVSDFQAPDYWSH